MADSNITKQALSSALKELMEEQSFERISVSDICERCHMNRKSFYYHFKDKYDLANWIFDTEFIELSKSHSSDVLKAPRSYEERWNDFVVVCEYFYENRNFYRRILQVEGQNSFSGHFRDFMYPILKRRVMDIVGQDDVPRMVLDFIVDGFECTIKRWLLDKNGVTADEFVGIIKQLILLLILGMSKRTQEEPDWVDIIKNRGGSLM